MRAATGSTSPPAVYGRKLRDNLLTKQIDDAVLNANADHTIAARTHSVKPEVLSDEVAAEYPTYLTLDRATFTLRLWKNLKLAKTYTVAVGHGRPGNAGRPLRDPGKGRRTGLARAGIGLGREPRRPGHPAGPANPIKARWMGIFEGAGIHGTEETYSLGSRRLARLRADGDPRREELYDQVEVGTPDLHRLTQARARRRRN